MTTPSKEIRVMIDLDDLARLEREANAEQEAEDAAGVEGCNVHSEDGMWPTTARAALIAAMRNALPGLLEELRHLRLGPGTCPNCGATWVNGLYVRVYDWARRWKQLAKRLRRRNKFLVRASRQYGAARAALAAMTERAERAEANYIGSEKDLDAKHAKLVEEVADNLAAARAELAAMTARAERAEKERDEALAFFEELAN